MFKRGAGLAITLALAVAAARYSAPAPSATQAVTSSAPEAPLTPADQHQPTYRGGCSAYLSGPATHGYPYDDNEGQAAELISKFLSPANDDLPEPISLNYAIALMPDPVHTNLSLMFDRQIVMIQQAAQDEGYTYNSSWLPWQKGEGARNQSRALVDQLVEGMLPVGARLTPVDRPGLGVEVLAVERDMLAV